MTEPNKDTSSNTGTDCSKCLHILYLTEKIGVLNNRTKEVEEEMESKVSFSTFKWIVAGLCTAAILVIGFNFAELKQLQDMSIKTHINQQLVLQDLAALKRAHEK